MRDDKKIDLSLQQPGYKKVGNISQTILDKIKDRGGMIPVTDKSPPEEIYSMFGVSKKVFKQSIGALYKKRLITLDANGLKIVKDKAQGSGHRAKGTRKKVKTKN